jgi:hypothetical protein
MAWVSVGAAGVCLLTNLVALWFLPFESARIISILTTLPTDAESQLHTLQAVEQAMHQVSLLASLGLLVSYIVFRRTNRKTLLRHCPDPRPVLTHWAYKIFPLILTVNILLALTVVGSTADSSSTDIKSVIAATQHAAHVGELSAAIKAIALAALISGLLVVIPKARHALQGPGLR